MNTNKVPEVSIALTSYDHEEFIAECLDSILSQEVDFEYEIVIGEDLSKDNTRKIIYQYLDKYPNIRLLERKKNLGYTRNFDDTMQQCRGKYIAIFDGDDIMLPGKLQKQKEALDQHPEWVLVGHQMDAFEDNTRKIIRTIEPKKYKPHYNIEDLIKWGSFFANSSKMFRKTAYPEYGINPQIKYIADWAVTLDIVSKGKIGFIWEKLALYRVHGVSIMQSIKGVADFEDKKTIIEDFTYNHPAINKSWFNNQWAYAFMVKGIDELIAEKRTQALYSLLKSITSNPLYSITPYYYLLMLVSPSFFRHRLVPKKYYRN
jgi:glycosyltransferase involved in cell wall biosynthesis